MRHFISEYKLRLVVILLSVLFLACLTAPFWILKLDNTVDKTLFTEMFKVLFQFIAIAFLGGIVVQKYNSSKQKDLDRKAFRRKIHKVLSDTYLDLKNIRWSLRFICHTKEISTKDYREHILKIAEIKTRLEMIDNEVDANRKAIKFIIEDLKDNLENMEKYLKKILDEFAF